MSDILIRGMEMPTSCVVCDWSSYVGNGRAMCSKTSMTEKSDIMSNRRPDWCPLVEVPPHGDLVDRNKLLEKAYYDYNEATHDYNHFRIVFEDDIIDAPVVIEGNTDRSEVTE